MVKVKHIIHTTINKFSIPDYAYINREDLTHVVLPEGMKSIGERAFACCKNLKTIVLPESLESIGASAFLECVNLEEVILPKNIKKLNYRVFGDCKRLKRVVIPEGVEEMDWGVFAGCNNLEEIVLPESLKKIDKQMFLNCKKLKKVTLPTNITKLPDEFFRGCFNLDIVLNSNIIELGKSVFEDCHHLSTFPEHVKSFGKNCFKNCRSITSVSLNEHITVLPDGLFEGCTNLLSIDSQNKLSIGKRCFKNCKSLKEILIQKNIYSMGSSAFSGCENLESFDIYNLHVIPAEAFSNCKKLKKVRFLAKIMSIESRAFYNCRNLTDINLPDTVEVIKKEAFRNCSSIKTITIPANLKLFGIAAFAYMDSLKSINVSPFNKTYSTPDNKILINDKQQKMVLYACGNKDKSYSFENYNVQYDESGKCTIIPINSIGEFAFAGAKNLEELTICACTQDIEATAFYGCKKLKKLNVVAIPLFTSFGYYIKDCGRYYVSQTSKYKAFIPFEEVSFSGELASIFPNALNDFTKVKKLTLPEDKSFAISGGAFLDCSLLEEVSIPKGVYSISDRAFNPATKLKFSNGLEFKNFIGLDYNTK